MLIRFEAANFRSILEPAELSMVAVDGDRAEARYSSNLGEGLLSVAAIFGPNASGKSNVLSALTWLCDAVRVSLRYWDDEIPVDQFALGAAPVTSSEFSIELLIENVRFEYEVELTRQEVVHEGLFHYPERRRRRIFERDRGELKIQAGLGAISGTRSLLTERTLALSAARRFPEPLVSTFTQKLLRTQTLAAAGRTSWLPGTPPTSTPSARPTRRWFTEPAPAQPTLFDLEDGSPPSFEDDRAQALALLRLADLGIVDVLVDEEEVQYRPASSSDSSQPGAGSDTGPRRSRTRVRLVHQAAGRSHPLDFSAESEGTRAWYRLIGPVLQTLRSGSLLLFDELDSSLHPTLTAELIRLFHDPATNPRGAQLVFTSHDTTLLNHLNRDEVWFTEKSGSGATKLGALAEFAGERVRKSRNIEDGYLQGRFGALPDTDRTELLRSLGLIG
jgi:predicted ATPase